MTETYIHGFTPEEQARLTRMQDILNGAELAALDLGGVRSILDVGSGLGQLTRDLARRAGEGVRVLGVERDERQLAEARRQAEAAGEAERVEFRRGSADDLPLLPGERGAFDLAHARFLLEHVRDPLAVVRAMAGAVRPGGRLVLVDDDHELLKLWPSLPSFDHAWTVYWESYRDHGYDPLVGRRLTELLHRAGARPVRTTVVFYGAVRGAPLFEPVVHNLAEVLRGAAGELDRSGRLPREEMDAALLDLEAWSQHPAATLWYSLPLAEGETPR